MSSAVKQPLGRYADRRWIRGMVYVVLVALIWIAASFVVKYLVGSGVSPFLVTYICNSLFIIYIPIVEVRQYLERAFKEHGWWGRNAYGKLAPEVEKMTELSHQGNVSLERETLLENVEARAPTGTGGDHHNPIEIRKEISDEPEVGDDEGRGTSDGHSEGRTLMNVDENDRIGSVDGVADKPWSRMRTAVVSLTICPFWFLCQFTFNLSLKYTTVTSTTILSTTASMFTFLVSVQFLGERFTWLKLASVLLCMAGAIIVSLGDSWKRSDGIASSPLFGDVVCLASAIFYAIYTAVIRVKISREDDEKGKVSTALVFGYLGFFNALLLAPVALLLHVTGIESFHRLTLTQVGLILGKGILDNVLSDYLWARAVLLTTPTAATAGLTIQYPINAVVDTIRGDVPSFTSILGAVVVLLGFFGINQVDPPESKPISEQDRTDFGDLCLDDAVTTPEILTT
ncbi:unnamed protein product [Calypogeia fissa]